MTEDSASFLSRRVLGIDVLRGFAALAVVFSHYLNWWDRYVYDIAVIAPGSYGYHAVQLFFAISGVVIFNTLNKCHSAVHFAFLRFSRLYPTYWTTLFGVAVVSWLVFGKEIWPGGLIVNATMFQEFLGYGHFDTVYWSLSAELAFYVLVGLLFWLSWHHRIYLICTGWLAVAAAWAIFIGKGDDRDLFSLLFVVDQAPFFVIGIMLYRIQGHGLDLINSLIILSALITAFLIEGLTGLSVAFLVVLLMALAMWGYLEFMTNRVTLWLGSISFALYLVHRNLGYLALERLSKADFGLIASLLVVIPTALALAWLVTAVVEKPSIRLLRRWHLPSTRQ